MPWYSSYPLLDFSFLCNYIDKISFSNTSYEDFESKGFICVNLTLNKEAHFDATVRVDDTNGAATGKLCSYISVCYIT